MYMSGNIESMPLTSYGTLPVNEDRAGVRWAGVACEAGFNGPRTYTTIYHQTYPTKSMAKKRRYTYYEAEWVAGGVYHVYNSGVKPNRLFVDPIHYRTFVEMLRDGPTFFSDIFAFALIPNHFHFALQLLSQEDLRNKILAKRRGKQTQFEKYWLLGDITYNKLIGDYWATFFSGYALYVNPLLKRRGTLLNQTVRRIRVRDDLVSRRLIMYIHTNEVKHGMLAQYDQSHYRTSFAYFLRSEPNQWLAKEKVLARFEGVENFLRRHEAYVLKYGHQLSAFDEELYFDPLQDGFGDAPYVEFLEGDDRAEEPLTDRW